MTIGVETAARHPTRDYAVHLSLATAAGGACGLTFWGMRNLSVGEPIWWQGGCLAAGLVALLFTLEAGKARRLMRRPATNSAPEPVILALPAPTLTPEPSETAHVTPSTEEEAMPIASPRTSPEVNIENERARLTRAGYSPAEISQILVARESAGPGAGPGFGSGVVTGVLNNFDAIATHVRGLVPSFKSDLTRVLDGRANSAERIGGAMSLAVKSLAVIILGYFVYLEALQFRANAYKAWADACIERQKNAINFSTLSELTHGNGPDRSLDQDCRGQ